MTIKEKYGSFKGLSLAWCGDGNNVLHDLAMGSLKVGMNVNIATPKGYLPEEDVITMAKGVALSNNVKLMITNQPKEAVKNVDIVVTDTWVSMGQESEAIKKKKDFSGYQINEELMNLAKPNSIFLHCLPRKKEEVSDEIFYSDKSMVFQEAENRMWTVMAITLKLLGKSWKL